MKLKGFLSSYEKNLTCLFILLRVRDPQQELCQILQTIQSEEIETQKISEFLK